MTGLFLSQVHFYQHYSPVNFSLPRYDLQPSEKMFAYALEPDLIPPRPQRSYSTGLRCGHLLGCIHLFPLILAAQCLMWKGSSG